MNTNANCFGPNGWGSYQVSLTENGIVIGDSVPYAELMIIPGFVDVHIHGAYGIDFMSSSSDDLLDLASKLEDEGYEAFLPTTVTESLESVKLALHNLPEHPAIPGFHLEGPFISKDYPGAQPKKHILSPESAPDWQEVLNHPKLKLITLAPELTGAKELIQDLSSRGVIVSAGHTNATFSQIKTATESGLSHITHTFNAMKPLHHREAGTVGAALLLDSISTEIIYDRFHVNNEVTELLLNSKPKEKIIGISDCTMAHGLKPGTELRMWGHDVIVNAKDVRIKNSGALAGSKASLKDVFLNLWEDFGVEIAAQACSINPRQILGLTYPPRTWLVFTSSKELETIVRTEDNGLSK